MAGDRGDAARRAQVQFQAGFDHHRSGRLERAAECYEDGLALSPSNVDAQFLLSCVWASLQAWARAWTHAIRALCLDPGAAAIYRQAALTQSMAGRSKPAVGFLSRALYLRPDFVDAVHDWGIIAARDSATAATLLHARAIVLDPGHQPSQHHLGLTLLQLDHKLAGLVLLDRARAIWPNSHETRFNRATALALLDRDREAAAEIAAAIVLRPDFFEALYQHAKQFQEKHRPDPASRWFQNALCSGTPSIELLNRLAAAHQECGRYERALKCFLQSLALAPDSSVTLNNIGRWFHALGYPAACRRSLNHALAISPRDPAIIRNRLSTMLYDPAASPAEICAEAKGLALRTGTASTIARPRIIAGSRIRIGYLSSDFRQHSVARNLLPILKHRDRQNFEVVCYANVPVPDAVTRKFMALSDGWVAIEAMSDQEAAERVRSDRIDILVVLAGRFDQNRPFIARHRAAPIQLSLHDAATSGINEMDYLIADPILAPRDDAPYFVERVLRLPCFVLQEPIEAAPPITRLPMLERIDATFASFNNPAKMNDPLLALWGRLLRAIPGSRLKLKYRNHYASQMVRSRIISGLGVPEDRVTFITEPSSNDEDHLNHYQDVDLALDTFPFSGSTTSFESLWMGVPVATIALNTMVARWTRSMLHALDMPEFIASHPTEFIELVIAAISHPRKLARLRAELRMRVAASSLCNVAVRTRQIERFYRALIRRHAGRDT